MIKSHKTYPELIERVKAKNIRIDLTDDECMSFLKSVNYYRLSAYWLPFMSSKDNCNNVSLSKIVQIYNFDK